ncbi:acetyl-coenzyme A synthetase N-terminal domain-containing protein [Psychrobium sp. nBUS_13]|uniref:acetyl-coenzyme A synthetase N-terminal domain-containing protein n=1 Tax=Psychrobium sp. nBUS_13 TaxID=3395319 RepID=UPI003EB6A542
MTEHIDYQTLKQQAIDNPEQYWGEAAKAISWHKEATQILDDSMALFILWCLAVLRRQS